MLLMLQAPSWANDHPTIGILVGLVALVIGAELLVRGAVWIALTIGMSRMAVGLTLVSIGTSLPELLVTLTAAQKGSPGLAMANVVGSNVANVLLIVGATAAIRAIHLRVRWLELGYMLLMTGLACVPFVYGDYLDRWLSAIMVAVLVVFVGQLLARERTARQLMVDDPRPAATPGRWLLNMLLLASGFVMLAYGAEWLVDGAVAVAMHIGMSEPVVGMTIVAIGTSLPELATSIVAAMRGQPELCIGNIIGSNIFNVGAVLGTVGLITPIPVNSDDLMSLMWMMLVSSVVLVLVLRRQHGVMRWTGLVFLLAYFGFMTYQVVNSGVE